MSIQVFEEDVVGNHQQDGKFRFQFSLRALLLVAAVSGIGLGWVAMQMRQARQQEEAAMAFIERGAILTHHDGIVTSIHFSNYTELSDDDLKHLEAMPHLDTISLQLTQVTDRGLAHLSKAPSLQEVHINESHVSDIGIENLSKLPRLEEVRVWGAGGTGSDAHVKLRKMLPDVEVK